MSYEGADRLSHPGCGPGHAGHAHHAWPTYDVTVRGYLRRRHRAWPAPRMQLVRLGEHAFQCFSCNWLSEQLQMSARGKPRFTDKAVTNSPRIALYARKRWKWYSTAVRSDSQSDSRFFAQQLLWTWACCMKSSQRSSTSALPASAPSRLAQLLRPAFLSSSAFSSSPLFLKPLDVARARCHRAWLPATTSPCVARATHATRAPRGACVPMLLL